MKPKPKMLSISKATKIGDGVGYQFKIGQTKYTVGDEDEIIDALSEPLFLERIRKVGPISKYFKTSEIEDGCEALKARLETIKDSVRERAYAKAGEIVSEDMLNDLHEAAVDLGYDGIALQLPGLDFDSYDEEEEVGEARK